MWLPNWIVNREFLSPFQRWLRLFELDRMSLRRNGNAFFEELFFSFLSLVADSSNENFASLKICRWEEVEKLSIHRNHFQLIREALRRMLLCAIEIQFMADSHNHREIIKREKFANINIRAHRFPQLLLLTFARTTFNIISNLNHSPTSIAVRIGAGRCTWRYC